MDDWEEVAAVEEEKYEGEGEPLGQEATKMYRALAARGNYLGPDRPDIQFAIKECCRDMSSPTNASWGRLKRVARFLQYRPRMVWRFD